MRSGAVLLGPEGGTSRCRRRPRPPRGCESSLGGEMGWQRRASAAWRYPLEQARCRGRTPLSVSYGNGGGGGGGGVRFRKCVGAHTWIQLRDYLDVDPRALGHEVSQGLVLRGVPMPMRSVQVSQ